MRQRSFLDTVVNLCDNPRNLRLQKLAMVKRGFRRLSQKTFCVLPADMAFRIQTYYPVAGMFMNTNHEAETVQPLIELLNAPMFAGFKAQIVDDENQVVYGPQTPARTSPPSVADIANMLGVPMFNSLDELYDHIGDENLGNQDDDM